MAGGNYVFIYLVYEFWDNLWLCFSSKLRKQGWWSWEVICGATGWTKVSNMQSKCFTSILPLFPKNAQFYVNNLKTDRAGAISQALPGVSPEYHWVWPQNKQKKNNQKFKDKSFIITVPMQISKYYSDCDFN